MSILRVLLDAVPRPSQAVSWALYDDAGARLSRGVDPVERWPAHDAIEVVLAATRIRRVPVVLPPLAAARTPAAVAFALEDQIASGEGATHIAVSSQHADGTIVATLVDRALMDALARREGPLAGLRRIVAEPDLVAPADRWRWCQSASTHAGFVRLPDGTAFAVGAATAVGALPDELMLALAQRRAGGPVPAVRVDGTVSASDLARWTQATGVPFVAGTPWQWDAAPPERWAGATDLLQGSFAGASSPRTAPTARAMFLPAAWLLAAALGLHVVATSAEWIALKVSAWRSAKAWNGLGLAAGLPRDALNDAASIRTALALRLREARHAHGLAAPDDALPLLARASVALQRLPAGAIKRASYAGGHWTFDFALADPAALTPVMTVLRQAHLDAVIASTPGGARMRLGAL